MATFLTLQRLLSTAQRSRKGKAPTGTNSLSFDVTITRFDQSEHGTFGQLVCNGFTCFTGELPEMDNKPNVSCIPKGHYICHWTYSPRFKRKMYEITSVTGRSGIRFHSANFMGSGKLKKQLNGCVALGFKLGVMEGQKALLLSSPAIRQFEKLLNGREFTLEIR